MNLCLLSYHIISNLNADYERSIITSSKSFTPFQSLDASAANVCAVFVSCWILYRKTRTGISLRCGSADVVWWCSDVEKSANSIDTCTVSRRYAIACDCDSSSDRQMYFHTLHCKNPKKERFFSIFQIHIHIGSITTYHLYGCSPVCMRVCNFKLYFSVNFLSQNSHEYRSSRVCDRICTKWLAIWEKALPQITQTYGRSPLCVLHTNKRLVPRFECVRKILWLLPEVGIVCVLVIEFPFALFALVRIDACVFARVYVVCFRIDECFIAELTFVRSFTAVFSDRLRDEQNMFMEKL